ncbi:hypothetical protein Tco_0552805 [Tanacetum coccineum]
MLGVCGVEREKVMLWVMNALNSGCADLRTLTRAVESEDLRSKKPIPLFPRVATTCTSSDTGAVTIAVKKDISDLIAVIGSSPFGKQEQLDWSLVGKIQIETVGDDVDEIDKQAELIGEMQLKPEDQDCVHASDELQLHVVHVVVEMEP